MRPSLRLPVGLCQRPAVTDFRDNKDMARPDNLPAFISVGDRVLWWRKHRKMSRTELASKVKLAYSTLADLENDKQDTTKNLHLIAEVLRVNRHYLETDEGDPEANVPTPAEPAISWPFTDVAPSRLERLNPVERGFAEAKLLEALAIIDAERRKSKKTG